MYILLLRAIRNLNLKRGLQSSRNTALKDDSMEALLPPPEAVGSPSPKRLRTEELLAPVGTAAPDTPGKEPVTFSLFSNDDSDETCRALIILKNIFSKQLPKMPKEYIVRLVFDRRHVTLALKRGPHIIGGVCYRPYFDQHFAEIAFLAVSANEQVRGFGTMLMNELKHHVQPQGILKDQNTCISL